MNGCYNQKRPQFPENCILAPVLSCYKLMIIQMLSMIFLHVLILLPRMCFLILHKWDKKVFKNGASKIF